MSPNSLLQLIPYVRSLSDRLLAAGQLFSRYTCCAETSSPHAIQEVQTVQVAGLRPPWLVEMYVDDKSNECCRAYHDAWPERLYIIRGNSSSAAACATGGAAADASVGKIVYPGASSDIH